MNGVLVSPPYSRRPNYVLLDRDGTINVERHFLSNPDHVELLPGAAEGMRRMQSLGLGLIVITNQSGIGRGYFDHQCLNRVHKRLIEMLAAENITLDAIYSCPDHPDSATRRRKPRPGMVEEAARDLCFDPSRAYMVGDRPSDIGLGRAVGATTFLVRTGYGHESEHSAESQPDYVVDDLNGVAELLARTVKHDSATRLSGSL